MPDLEYNSEIHIIFLNAQFKDDKTGVEEHHKLINVAYFCSDIMNDKNRRRLLHISQEEWESFEKAFNGPIENGEKAVFYYCDNDKSKSRLDLYSPYGDHSGSISNEDSAFVFETTCYNGKDYEKDA